MRGFFFDVRADISFFEIGLEETFVVLVGIGNRKSEIVVETLLWEDFLRGFLSEKVSNYRKVGRFGCLQEE